MPSRSRRRYRGRHRMPPSHRGRYLAAAGVVAVASVGVLTDHTTAPTTTLSAAPEPPTVHSGPPPAAPAADVAVTTALSADIPYPAPALISNDVPAMALMAYQRAAATLAVRDPGCHLSAALLAAIGKVESNHARGGWVDASGTTLHPILGPVLNGGPFAAIPDTDAGRLDGDLTWDRAVGPMQFIPSTWASWAADGNADARSDPQNLFDAAVAAGRYLCAGDRDLGTSVGLEAAIRGYNNSDAYLRLVLEWAARYSGAMTATPGEPVSPAESGVVQVAASTLETLPTQPSQPDTTPTPVPTPTSPPIPTPTSAPISISPPATASVPTSTPGTGSGSTSPSSLSAAQLAQPLEISLGGAVSVAVGVGIQTAPCGPTAPPAVSASDALAVQLCVGSTVVPLPTLLGLIAIK